MATQRRPTRAQTKPPTTAPTREPIVHVIVKSVAGVLTAIFARHGRDR